MHGCWQGRNLQTGSSYELPDIVVISTRHSVMIAIILEVFKSYVPILLPSIQIFVRQGTSSHSVGKNLVQTRLRSKLFEDSQRKSKHFWPGAVVAVYLIFRTFIIGF